MNSFQGGNKQVVQSNLGEPNSQEPTLGFPSDIELTKMANAMFASCGDFGSSPFESPSIDPASARSNSLTPLVPSQVQPELSEGLRNIGSTLPRSSPPLPIDMSQESSARVPGLNSLKPHLGGVSPGGFDLSHPSTYKAKIEPDLFLRPSSALPLSTALQNERPTDSGPTNIPQGLGTNMTDLAGVAEPSMISNPFAFYNAETHWAQPTSEHRDIGWMPAAVPSTPVVRGSKLGKEGSLDSATKEARGFSPTLAAAYMPMASAFGFDPEAIRQDFPILQEVVNGKPLIWLDNAATTQKPSAVVERLNQFYLHENSNIHRAAHELARRSTDAYEAAREAVARFIHASSANEIVFVRGTTEAINLVAQTFGRLHVSEGDEIIVTHLEHHANIVPWQQLCAQMKARLLVAPVDVHGQILLEDYRSLFSNKTRLVALSQVSNALGTVTPAREMVEIAHRLNVPVLVDGAQSVSHMRVDVQQLDCDFFVFSGHKIFGPTGIGVLYGKESLLNEMPPWQGGGNMIQDVTFERTVYHAAPMRFEAGTGNIADAVGLKAALDYVERLGIDNIARYEHELLEYGTIGLNQIPGLRIIGTAAEKAGVLSFVVAGVETETIGKAMNKEGIAVRSGHHCAQPILRRFGVEATVRASLAFYNTRQEIDRLVSVVRQVSRP